MSLLIGNLFSSIHLCVTLLHTKEGVADQFIRDARECLEELLNSPDAEAGGMVRTLIVNKQQNLTTLDINIQNIQIHVS